MVDIKGHLCNTSPQLSIQLQPSRIHAVMAGVSLCGALYAVWLAALWTPLKTILIGGIVIYGLYYYCRFIVFRHRDSVQRLNCIDQQWRVYYQGQWQAATLVGESVVTPHFISLSLQLEALSTAIHVTVFYDSLPAQVRHQLRLQLLLKLS